MVRACPYNDGGKNTLTLRRAGREIELAVEEIPNSVERYDLRSLVHAIGKRSPFVRNCLDLKVDERTEARGPAPQLIHEPIIDGGVLRRTKLRICGRRDVRRPGSAAVPAYDRHPVSQEDETSLPSLPAVFVAQ